MKRGLLLLVLSACGAELEAPAPLQVEVASSAPWAAAPDTDARIRARVELSLAYWQAPPEVLDGWTLALTDDACAYSGGRAGGCAIMHERRIEVSTSFGPCPEAAPIAHEVGHVAIDAETGDPDGDHSDPRWYGLFEAGLGAGASRCP